MRFIVKVGSTLSAGWRLPSTASDNIRRQAWTVNRRYSGPPLGTSGTSCAGQHRDATEAHEVEGPDQPKR